MGGIPIDWWIILGFAGQGLFFMRFLVQWISSERKGESVVPVYFWYFSIAGALVILVYAWHQQDPVFIVGQASALLIYIRNLMLIHKQNHATPAA